MLNHLADPIVMRMNTRFLAIAVVLLLIGLGIALYAATRPAENQAALEPTTFEECAALYPVMESFPRQCNTPNGGHFVEEVAAPVAPTPVPATVGIPDLIEVSTPTIGQKIASPVTVTGSARGMWYFEATFPIEIRNAAGTVIGNGYAEAQSDWMTENFVAFRGTVTFTPQTAGSTGFVVLKKSNASGDPERDQSVQIPITF